MRYIRKRFICFDEVKPSWTKRCKKNLNWKVNYPESQRDRWGLAIVCASHCLNWNEISWEVKGKMKMPLNHELKASKRKKKLTLGLKAEISMVVTSAFWSVRCTGTSSAPPSRHANHCLLWPWLLWTGGWYYIVQPSHLEQSFKKKVNHSNFGSQVQTPRLSVAVCHSRENQANYHSALALLLAAFQCSMLLNRLSCWGWSLFSAVPHSSIQSLFSPQTSTFPSSSSISKVMGMWGGNLCSHPRVVLNWCPRSQALLCSCYTFSRQSCPLTLTPLEFKRTMIVATIIKVGVHPIKTIYPKINHNLEIKFKQIYLKSFDNVNNIF